MNDLDKRRGFTKGSAERLAKAGIAAAQPGGMPMPPQVFASIVAIVNSAMQGRTGQMEIGTIDETTKKPGKAIRIIALPADIGTVEAGIRTIQVPEVFGEKQFVAEEKANG